MRGPDASRQCNQPMNHEMKWRTREGNLAVGCWPEAAGDCAGGWLQPKLDVSGTRAGWRWLPKKLPQAAAATGRTQKPACPTAGGSELGTDWGRAWLALQRFLGAHGTRGCGCQAGGGWLAGAGRKTAGLLPPYCWTRLGTPVFGSARWAALGPAISALPAAPRPMQAGHRLAKRCELASHSTSVFPRRSGAGTRGEPRTAGGHS